MNTVWVISSITGAMPMRARASSEVLMPSAAMAVMIRNEEMSAIAAFTPGGTTPTELSAAKARKPNRKIGGGPSGEYLDLDLTSKREKTGGPTYAAVTARSYHPGGVNALFGDGSVKFVKSTVNGQAWRSLGSVAGGEVISADSF